MRSVTIAIWVGVWIVSLCFGAQVAFAQEEGWLAPLPADSASNQNMLPAGAVYEGTQVLHKISSTKENLHLLAAYYYGNPRLWKKIYDNNRNLIKNPNRLPVGQTIRINVGEAWQPKFSYQEWFNRALRNGEWKSGQRWQKTSGAPAAAPTPAAGTREISPSQEQNVAPEPQATPKAETSKILPVMPVKKAPAEVTPTPQAAAQETPTARGTPTPKKPAKIAW